MANLDKVANTLQGRIDLLHCADTIFGGVKNEMAFFICVREYKLRPSKTRAILLHSIYLANHENNIETSNKRLTEFSLNTGIIPINTYKTHFKKKFATVVGNYRTAQGMPTVWRKLTSFTRKAPSDLFDALINPFKTHMTNFMSDDVFNPEFAREFIRGFRVGGMGRKDGGEQRAYKTLVGWSNRLSKMLYVKDGFDPFALGIANVFQPAKIAAPKKDG
ncbi:MAG: hypothetical protein JRJ85_11630 [Deltaproteobacteria bacterium]|nr:hypothetical protein [Deltaproteobacteria bacterium]